MKDHNIKDLEEAPSAGADSNKRDFGIVRDNSLIGIAAQDGWKLGINLLVQFGVILI